MMAAAGAVVV